MEEWVETFLTQALAEASTELARGHILDPAVAVAAAEPAFALPTAGSLVEHGVPVGVLLVSLQNPLLLLLLVSMPDSFYPPMLFADFYQIKFP